MAGPDQMAAAEAHAMPHDMKMLPVVLDMLDDDLLVLAGGVAVFLYKGSADARDLVVD